MKLAHLELMGGMERQARPDLLDPLELLGHREREETGASLGKGVFQERLEHKDLQEKQAPMEIQVYLDPLDYLEQQALLETQYASSTKDIINVNCTE